MVVYEVIMPRWAEDIATRKRTLIHLICRPDDPVVVEGDGLQLEQRHTGRAGDVTLERPPGSAVTRVAVTSVSRVRLVDSLTPVTGLKPGPVAVEALADMRRPNLIPADDRARVADLASAISVYRQRWNAVNSDAPWESNPTVWRIVFRYLETPPELGLAV